VRAGHTEHCSMPSTAACRALPETTGNDKRGNLRKMLHVHPGRAFDTTLKHSKTTEKGRERAWRS
jgi:hypothetical protein